METCMVGQVSGVYANITNLSQIHLKLKSLKIYSLFCSLFHESF